MNSGDGFAINGRFLTQSVTGVQRYAINIVYELNELLSEKNIVVPIFSPANAKNLALSHIPLSQAGVWRGHPWEQLMLPSKWSGSLLNFCNTAPVAKTNQILCIHDANVFLYPKSYGMIFRNAYRVSQPIIAHRVAKVTTVSTDAAKQIAVNLNLDLRNIEVIYNGHEHALTWDSALARVGPTILEAHESYGRPFVLSIGSRAIHKNMSLILKIAPKLAELGVDIIIVGGDSGIFSEDKLSNQDNVQFSGRVSDHDLAYLMDRALCLLFPSWTEGFGLPIVESMARGCPVISSNRASMPEICGQSALMADPDDCQTWIDHVGTLLERQGPRQDLIESGRVWVKKFSWKKSAAAYLDMMSSSGL